MHLTEKQQLEKIASLFAHGVSQADIAEVFGVTEGRISQLKETVEFKAAFEEKQNVLTLREQELNEGWDKIEEKAIEQIHEKLEAGFDPNFALRAGVMANKAQRRGRVANLTLDAAGRHEGGTVKLNLTKVTINQFKQEPEALMREGFPTAKVEKDIEGRAIKQTDVCEPAKVTQLFETNTESPTQHLLDGMVSRLAKSASDNGGN